MDERGYPNVWSRIDRTGSAGPHRWNRKRFSVAGRELIDTLDAVRRYDFVVRTLPSYRLKEVARHFGLASPERIYVKGARVYETYLYDPDSVRHYALDDVREVDGLVATAPWVRPLPSRGWPRAATERICRLGGSLPWAFSNSLCWCERTLRAGSALPQAGPLGQEETFGRHQGGATYLLEEGVAEHVG